MYLAFSNVQGQDTSVDEKENEEDEEDEENPEEEEEDSDEGDYDKVFTHYICRFSNRRIIECTHMSGTKKGPCLLSMRLEKFGTSA